MKRDPLKYLLTESEIEIQNMVASVNLRGTINLEKCARILPRCMYEPEQFPALIYRSDSPAVMLVFSSGKLAYTGCKTEEDNFRLVVISIPFWKRIS